MKKVYIVKAEIDCDRIETENLEGHTFSSVEDFWGNEDVKEMMKHGEVLLEEISNFTTDWNDTDDEDDFLRPYNYFIAWVFIGE